jgi:hypothetical protein
MTKGATFFFGLWIFLSAYANADSASVQMNPVNFSLHSMANKLAQAIRSKEQADPQKLNLYLSLWKNLCGGKKASTCYLPEAAVLGNKGRADHVFMFRGEPGKHSLPATASFLRHILSGNSSLCGPDCEYTKLNSVLEANLTEFLKQNISFSRHSTVMFDETSGQWTVNSPMDKNACQMSDYDQFIPVSQLAKCAPGLDSTGRVADDSLTRYKPLSFLVAAHLSSTERFLLQTKDRKKIRLDAMVSFTSSPFVAIDFTRNQGEVIVISVNKSKIKSSRSRDCKSMDLAYGELLKTAICRLREGADDDWSMESEYDYQFLANPADIFEVIPVE